ncbi:hypothetical protein [Salinispora arenicola]|uniref:hypothetical protein n=1 Tax=Salinispora arenicola TaxID=168697 RepID=UPI00037BF1DF|nr:hypothetical protein [Salinispora arenicola]
MNHRYHTHEPDRPDRNLATSRRRWWVAGLAGTTGLALATTIAPTPAAAASAAAASAAAAAERTIPVPFTVADSRTAKPPADSYRGEAKHDDKGKGTKGQAGKGKESTRAVLVPCDADRLITAITLANARGGAVLNLAKKCAYTLTADLGGAGLPAITAPITLNGGTHTTITRAAAAPQFRIITVDTGGDLTLNHLTITGGQTTDDGGGILVNQGGALTTNHSTITRNITSNNGGGISSNGTVHMKTSTVSHNTADSIAAGILSLGILDISKSQVHANTAVAGGAGVIAFGATRIKHSSITANHGQNGTVGGLFISGTGTVTDSNISGNTALEAAGVLTDTSTQLTLRSVTLADNTAVAGVGGGLAINPGSSVVTEGGIIANNTATTEGGGIFNLGELVSRNTKIIGNRSDLGGGISNASNTATANLFGTQVIKNIAITDGGGIFNNGGTVELNTATGTIVVKNRPNNCVGVPECSG